MHNSKSKRPDARSHWDTYGANYLSHIKEIAVAGHGNFGTFPTKKEALAWRLKFYRFRNLIRNTSDPFDQTHRALSRLLETLYVSIDESNTVRIKTETGALNYLSQNEFARGDYEEDRSIVANASGIEKRPIEFPDEKYIRTQQTLRSGAYQEE